MAAYIIAISIGAFSIGFLSQFIQSLRSPNSNIHESDRMFFNSPEENEKEQEIIRSRSIFQSLLENAALVLLVLVCYWLCL